MNFNSLVELATLLASKGITASVTRTLLGNIAVATLQTAPYSVDNKGRGSFEVAPGIRVFLDRGVNPTSLKGEIYLIEGKSAKLVKPAVTDAAGAVIDAGNPTGKWSMAVVA